MDTDAQMHGLTCREAADNEHRHEHRQLFFVDPLRITHESISSDKASRESN